MLSALLLLSSISAVAQTQTTGAIAGSVKDPNGAVIIGAEVRIMSLATGEERKASTDSGGGYTVALLPPGAYRLTVAFPGFATASFDRAPVL